MVKTIKDEPNECEAMGDSSKPSPNIDLQDILQLMKRKGVKPLFVCVICSAQYKYLKCWNKHVANHFEWFSGQRVGEQRSDSKIMIGSKCQLCTFKCLKITNQ